MKTLPFRIAGILFVLIAPLCFVGAIGSALSLPKLYTATTILRASADGNPSPENLRHDLQQKLSSDDLLRALAKEGNLSVLLGAYLNEDRAPLPLPEVLTYLRERFSLSVVDSRQLTLALSLQAEDPALAADTVNGMAALLVSDSATSSVASVNKGVRVEVVDMAYPPSKPSSPSIFRAAVYSNFAGMVFLTVGIVLLIFPRKK